MRAAWILCIAIIAVIFSCQRNTSSDYDQSDVWEAYKSPAFKHISLYDTLPKKAVDYLSAVEIHGVRAIYRDGRHTSYLEYEADPLQVLYAVQAIPFGMNEAGDTLCREINQSFSLSGQRVLSNEEKIQTSFFWKINPDSFVYYECVKGKQRHTILVSRDSNRILHRVETLA